MDLEKLKARIDESGISRKGLAEIMSLLGCEISVRTLYRNLSGEQEFTVSEIIALSVILELSDEEILDIFFCNKDMLMIA